jgi:hypothetical protein
LKAGTLFVIKHIGAVVLIRQGHPLYIIIHFCEIWNYSDKILKYFLKMFVVQFVYLLIPLIVIFVGAWASIASMSVTASGNVANPNLFLGLMGGTAIIGFILAIIFQLIGSIAVANMALNDSEFGAAFRFSEILELISMIGWGKYIIWYIVMIIIGIVFMVIASVLQIIPFIGMIIATLVVYPYLTMFSSRSLALLFGSSVELE